MNKELTERRAAHTDVYDLVDLIAAANPLQRKRLEGFLARADDVYWAFADDLAATLGQSFLIDDATRAEAARAYNKMCMDFLAEQIRFKKTGRYRVSKAADAEAHVYSDVNVMRYYMVGLLLSYMFWPNHYRLFRFFLDTLPDTPPARYLEVGVGHGLFTSTMLTRYPAVEAVTIDISETSIRTAKETLATFGQDAGRVRFVHGDYLTTDIGESGFDTIIMGEVLEHVDDAPGFMARAKTLLAPAGRIYMSTCANCPALDHVYHFHNCREIRDLVEGAGLRILDDLALAAEAVPEEEWERELVTVNYCGLLAHA